MHKRKLEIICWLIVIGCSCISGVQAQRVDWSLSYPKAENVNVGSSNPSDIEIKFEVADAPMSQAEITVTFPYAQDIYDEISNPAANIGGGSVNWGTLNWNAGTRTLTFPTKNLSQNSTVWYKIPRKATDALPLSITSGNVRITIKDNGTVLSDTTLAYNYNRAALSIVSPTSLPSGQSNLTLSFGNNNGAHNPGTNTDMEYRFGLRTNGGEIDSVRAKFTFPTAAITLTPNSWKANGITVTRVSSAPSGNNTIYTLYLEKIHSIGGDGFGNGETVNISLRAKKNSCGNSTVSMNAAWGSSTDYVTGSAVNGSFAANSGSGTPSLKRAGTTPEFPGMRNVDGTTGNSMITKIRNDGTGDAANIIYSLTTSTGEYSSFLTADPVSYSVNGGATWSTLTPVALNSGRGAGSGAYQVNISYRNKPTQIRMTIPENLPAGQELWIKWKSYTAPDMFYNTTEIDRKWVRSVRHDDYMSYTDLCATATYNIQSASIYSLADYMTGTNLGPSVNLSSSNPSVEARLFMVTFNAHAQSLLFQNGSGYAKMRVVLPKGIKIEKSSPTAYKVKVGNSLGTGSLMTTTIIDAETDTTSSPQNIYTFKINVSGSGTRYVFITFRQDCSQGGAVSGLHSADISFDLYPTGTDSGSGANVRMPKVLQFYSLMSLNCSPTNFSYTLDMERKTLGLVDSNDDGKPDLPLTKMHPGHTDYPKVDHLQMVTGDTTFMKFNGLVNSGSYPVLYAVVFSEENQNMYSILKDIVTVSSGHNATLLNSVSGTTVTPFNVGGSAPKRFAYIWKITKQGGGNFTTGNQITLNVPFKAVSTSGSYQPSNYKLGSWFYASPIDLGNSVNFTSGTNPGRPGANRHGDEEYGVTTTYYRGSVGAWSQVTTLNFAGPQQIMGGAYYNPVYHPAAAPAGWTPFEFRNIGTVDTVYVVVPEGYRINNTMRFGITGDASNGSNVTANSITADPIKSTKTKKAFVIRNNYITGAGQIYTANPTAGSNQIRISEGSYILQVRPDIIATPRAPQGTSTLNFTVYPNGTEFSQAHVPNASVSRTYGASTMVYSDAKDIKISTTDAVAQNVSKERLSWNFKLENPSSSTANVIWLYVEGPVKNASFNGISGQGENNRWIKVTSLAPGSSITNNLSFEVMPNRGCSDTTVTVYPIYQPGALSSWIPFGGTLNAAAFNTSRAADGGDFDLYVYKDITLTLQAVSAQISGSITPWATTPSNPQVPSSPAYGLNGVDKGSPFVVEVVLDASASPGPVSKLSVEMDFPRGLEYHVDSAFIKYKGTVLRVTDSSWKNKLTALIGDATPRNNVVFNLQDLYTTQSAALKPLFGDSATIDGGSQLYFRFKLRPTCDIAITGEQIGARFSGKRFCDNTQNVITTGQTARSSQLSLLNPLIGYRSGLTLTPALDSLLCEPGRDRATMSLLFYKKNKAAEAMSVTDSIRIAIPAVLTFEGDVNYSFPAYNLHSLNIPAESGSIPTGQMGNWLSPDRKTRYLSWPVPKAYLDQLATQSVANDSANAYFIYQWTVKAGNEVIRTRDTSKIHAATLAEYGVHITCPNKVIAEADSADQQVIMVPSRNAYLNELWVNGKLVQDFNPSQLEGYEIVLPCGTEDVDIIGVPFSPCAYVQHVIKAPLERYFKRFEVIVTAEDGVTQQTYAVNVRPLMPAKITKDLPGRLVACQHVPFPMSVEAEGDSLMFEWYWNGMAVGVDNDTLLFTVPDQQVHPGYYYSIVNGACASADTSNVTNFWVALPLPDSIEIRGEDKVYTRERYRYEVGNGYGFDDVTFYNWEFSREEEAHFYHSNVDSTFRYIVFPFFYGPTEGIGELKLSMEHPCGLRIVTKDIEVMNVTGIDDVHNNRVLLYPNPVDKELHISFEGEILLISVTDLAGRPIAIYKEKTESIPTSAWEKGTYIVTIHTTTGKITHKVIKK